MPLTADRVYDTSSSTGTGNFTVTGSPPSGYQAWSVFPVGSSVYYVIAQAVGGLWESGWGTMLTSTSFSRDRILDGSSGPNTPVNFTAATIVFNDLTSYAVKRGRWGLQLAQQYSWILG